MSTFMRYRAMTMFGMRGLVVTAVLVTTCVVACTLDREGNVLGLVGDSDSGPSGNGGDGGAGGLANGGNGGKGGKDPGTGGMGAAGASGNTGGSGGEDGPPCDHEGESCDSGTVCRNNGGKLTCAAGCYIDGQYYTPDQKHPSIPCKACDPLSADKWSRAAVGTSCGGGNTYMWCNDSGDCDRTSTVSAGGQHTCVLSERKRVMCWGRNDKGQLGSSDSQERYVPTPVSLAKSDVEEVSTGGHHTCVRTTDGGMKCWGDNADSQLGASAGTYSSSAVSVLGLLRQAKAIAAGGAHSCAVVSGEGSSDDLVYCWGQNGFGQTGSQQYSGPTLPVLADTNKQQRITAISAGAATTCVVREQNSLSKVVCWGSNRDGQAGDSSSSGVAEKATPTELCNGKEVSVGGYVKDGIVYGHTCVRANGGAVCFGNNDQGQLGIEGSQQYGSLRSALSDVLSIASGAQHTCAIAQGKSVMCWGGNRSGQLGNDLPGYSKQAIRVEGLNSGVRVISAGGNQEGSHTCVVTVEDEVKCWGSNTYGQLGNGTTVDKISVPVNVVGLSAAP